MQQLRLKVLNAPLCLVLLGQVADETGKESGAPRLELADLQLHREGLAAFA